MSRIHSVETRPAAAPAHRPATPVRPLDPRAQEQRAKIRNILRVPAVQAKLTIGAPNDEYEREADRLANEIIRMPVPGSHPVQRECAACKGSHSLPGPGGAPTIRRCTSWEGADSMQARVQPSADSSAATADDLAPPAVEAVLQGGAGQPLDARTRAVLEPRFGFDFSRVRIHHDQRAADAARSVNALAFTVGDRVVFGARTYAPATKSGLSLLAHELTHVVQQGGASPIAQQGATSASRRFSGSAPRIARTPGPLLQRDVGETPADRFTALVPAGLAVDPEHPVHRQRAEETKRRFLRTSEGGALINDLARLFCDTRGCRTRITVTFSDTMPNGADSATGYFEPAVPNASQYNVHVSNHRLPDGHRESRRQSSAWPVDNPKIMWRFQDNESYMAVSLHHELAHVWFVNAVRDSRNNPTGHTVKFIGGDIDRPRTIVDRRFLGRLQRFNTDLSELESTLAAEAAQAAEAARRPSTPPSPSTVEETPARPAAPRSRFGVDLTAAGGAYWGSGALRSGGLGLFGADHSFMVSEALRLRIGARGMFIISGSPGVSGLVGGAAGMDARLGTSETHVWLLHLDAGILAEVTPSAASRITDSVMGMGSAAIGGRVPSAGPGFIWRVGGFAIISDRAPAGSSSPSIGGGVAGAIGVAF